jgi:DNA helicase-2/ATP-dependent DNA helicase PcrA
MTLHAAKGLEFPVVAIIGLEDGILPHARARGNPLELEEERRLFFVGITRAQERIIISNAGHRMMRGVRERTIASKFLAEMPMDALIVVDRTGPDYLGDRSEERQNAMIQAQQLALQFRRGQLVRHPKFGLGRVQDVSDMGQHTRANIQFDNAGHKTLILQYTTLEIVG